MLAFIPSALIAVAIVNSALGAMIFFGGRRTKNSVVFSVFTLSVSAWCFGIAEFYVAPTPDVAFFYVQLYYIAALCIAYTLLAFMLAFTNTMIGFASRLAMVLPVIFLGYVTLQPAGLIESVAFLPERSVALSPVYYGIYTACFLIYFAIGLVVMLRALRRAQAEQAYGRIRNLRYVLVAIFVAGSVGIAFNLLLPFLGNYELIWVGPLGSLAMVSLIFIAVTRHNLFDVRMVFARATAYVLLVAILFAIYVGIEWTARIIFGEASISQLHFVIAIAVVLNYPYVKNLIDKLTNSVFFRDHYDTRTAIDRFSHAIVAEHATQQLLERARYQIAMTLHPEYVTVIATNLKSTKILAFAGDEPSHVERDYWGKVSARKTAVYRDPDDVDANTPAFVGRLAPGGQLVGFLVLGDKKNGEVYHEHDKQYLRLVMNELSIAVQNMLRYDEIRNFNETLRARVLEATNELRATNKKLKAMDLTKDEFISLTSHQLRTPLTTIKGYISMLLDGDVGELQPQQRKLLEEAFNSSQRMVHLISDFLNISRIQTGRFVLELTDVNLADVLDEEIEQLRVSADSRQIKLVYDKPETFPTMQVDEGKIRQVMMNFIDNAIYYSLGGTTVNIVLSHSAKQVEFKVIDQGIGVPKDEQHKLFTKFSRASNAKKQRPDGTGIGLYMAKKVVVALGGVVLFESKEGQGSTFGFRLTR